MTTTPGIKSDTVRQLVMNLAGAFLAKLDPSQIRVIELTQRMTVTLSPVIDDYGPLIGSRGVMFKAMEKLVLTTGERLGMEIEYAVRKPPGVEPERTKFKADPNWKSEKVVRVMTETIKILFSYPGIVEAQDYDDTTVLKVVLDPIEFMGEEKKHEMRQIEAALNVIFHTIGKATGRNEILVELISA
jgi:predicted RNA-binding protein YlqC (UPF0109 family)